MGSFVENVNKLSIGLPAGGIEEIVNSIGLINQSVNDSADNALIATQQATIATTKVGEASASASNALTQANRSKSEADRAQGYAGVIKVKSVPTIEDLALEDGVVFNTIIVKDLSRGGTFIWSATGTANGGTVFAGATGFWTRQYSGAVNVKWFGAKGDGVQDDTLAIQNAINSIVATGGIVYIPKGEYLNDGIEILNDFIEIHGDGDSTILKYTNITGTAASISFGQSKTGSGTLVPVKRCAVKNIKIDGNRVGGAVGAGIRSTVFDGFYLENVNVVNCAQSYGFAIVGTGLSHRNDLIVNNCSAYACGADGMDIKAGVERIIIDGFISGGHLDETDGDSVGLDLRGHFISAQNIFVYDVLDIGIRVRANVGEYDPAYPDFTLGRNGQISINNCFVKNIAKYGYSLDGSESTHIVATGIHAKQIGKFGVGATAGSVTINGCSVNEALGGLLTGDGNVVINGLNCYNISQDAIVHSSGTLTINGGRIKTVMRSGLNLRASTASMKAKLIGVTFDGCLTCIVGESTSEGKLEMDGCNIINTISRAIQLASAPMVALFSGGAFENNYVNVYSSSLNTKFRDVAGIVSFMKYSDSIALTAIANLDASIPHGLYRAPLPHEVSFMYERETDVVDYVIGNTMTKGSSSTILNVRTTIRTASVTPGSTIKRHVIIDLTK